MLAPVKPSTRIIMATSEAANSQGHETISVTIEQAQSILRSHLGSDVEVTSLEVLPISGFSAFTTTCTYSVYVKDGHPYLLRVQPAKGVSTSGYAPNTLAAESHLISLLAKHTSVPHTTVHKLDDSLQLVPYYYLLLSSPRGISLSQLKPTLTERQKTLIDLRLGMYFKQVHLEVQNDWFGLPSQEKEELYSWQEAFTGLLESLLHEAKELEIEVSIPFEDVRRYLSRAIGSFLFDDCEVPSLVSFTGDDHTVFIDVGKDEEDVTITSFITLSHAIWGDPLLESVFIGDPEPAFLEGYGGNPILFARQRTKRTWYTLFLALMITIQAKKGVGLGPLRAQEDGSKVAWAKGSITACIEKLKDAPCY